MRFRELNAGMPGTYARVRKLVPQGWVPRLMSRTVIGPFMCSFMEFQHDKRNPGHRPLIGIDRTDPSLLRMKAVKPELVKTPW